MATSKNNSVTGATAQYQKYHVGHIITNRFTHQEFIHALEGFEGEKQLTFKEIGPNCFYGVKCTAMNLLLLEPF